jgi:hypothetical protein
MEREEAKRMAQSRDCHCVLGKDRDSNFNEVIDKVFDYFESELKKLRVTDVSSYLPLDELERRLDEQLGKETKETLLEWLNRKRQ